MIGIVEQEQLSDSLPLPMGIASSGKELKMTKIA